MKDLAVSQGKKPCLSVSAGFSWDDSFTMPTASSNKESDSEDSDSETEKQPQKKTKQEKIAEAKLKEKMLYKVCVNLPILHMSH